MRRLSPWLILVLVACLSASVLGQERAWHDRSGNKVVGEITGRDDDSITLRLSDGSSLVIPLNDLAPADRRAAFAWRPRQVKRDLAFGQPWRVAFMKMEFAWVPPGSFRQGSSVLEEGRGADESPREVVLSRGFWLSKSEVTQAQWSLLMVHSPSRFVGPELPVDRVSWDEATAFCKKMTLRARAEGSLPEGYVYTLPSEAQWEYACRAGAVTAFGHGNEKGSLENYGWTRENALGKTHPVAALRPNRWGLHDMHGNVLEWCRDYYGKYPKGKTTNPAGASVGEKRVARGGCILNPRLDCRSAKRYKGDPSEKDMVGLRVALTQR